ncbi:MAG: CBS domain-containing protein [Sphingomonadaceae bacterium]
MSIESILREKGTEVATIGVNASLGEIVAELVVRRIGALLVLDGNQIVGLVSERDVVRALAAERDGALGRTAREVMTSPVITISPHDSVHAAMQMMTGRRIRHLPVVDDGCLVGLVSIGDLVKRRIEEIEQEALALKDYIATG